MKREIKGYKIKHEHYQNAMQKADKNGKFLAQLIEQFVIDFKDGRFVFDGNRITSVVKITRIDKRYH
jgi:hypothetical protein